MFEFFLLVIGERVFLRLDVEILVPTLNFLLNEPPLFSISEQELIIPKKNRTDVTSVPSHSLV